MKKLTGKQNRHLRSLGHHLKPVAQVGQRGVTEAVVEKIKDELEHHELIKVKVGQDSLDSAKEVGAALAKSCNAFLPQVIGRTILLYRPRNKDPEITLP